MMKKYGMSAPNMLLEVFTLLNRVVIGEEHSLSRLTEMSSWNVDQKKIFYRLVRDSKNHLEKVKA